METFRTPGDQLTPRDFLPAFHENNYIIMVWDINISFGKARQRLGGGRKRPEQGLWNARRPRLFRSYITRLNEVEAPAGPVGYLGLNGHQGSLSLISNSKTMWLLVEIKVLRNETMSKAFPPPAPLNFSRFLPTTEAGCVMTAFVCVGMQT